MSAPNKWKVSAGVEYSQDERINLGAELFGAYDHRWEMEQCERAGLLRVLEVARPEVSIEIGTANGGSLSAIAKHSGKVFTLDLDPRARERVGINYPNVEYVPGNSSVTLPSLLKQLQDQHAPLGFILVDGAHDPAGVRADLNAILAYEPACPLWIVMHDSFNPPCREGIRSAAWESCPFLHLLELDFVPGILHTMPALRQQMWGGLAVAHLRPEKVSGGPTLGARQQALFERAKRGSAHSFFGAQSARVTRKIDALKSRLSG